MAHWTLFWSNLPIIFILCQYFRNTIAHLPKALDNGFEPNTKTFNLFSECLLIWKYSELNTAATNEFVFWFHTQYHIKNSVILQSDAFRNTSNASVVVASHYFTRFSPCHVLFFEVQKDVEKLKPKAVGLEDDPAFIVYFAAFNHGDMKISTFEIMRIVQKQSREHPYSGVPLILAEDGNLHILCIVNSSFCYENTLITSDVSMKEIEKVWKYFHNNLNGLEVIRGGQQLNPTCKIANIINSHGPPSVCIHEILEQMFNATLTFNPSLSLNNVDIIAGVTLSSGLATGLKQMRRQRGSQFSIPVPGITNIGYAFIIITRENDVLKNLSAVTKPFQLNTWIAIIVSLLVISVTLMISTASLSQFRKSISIKNYWEWIFLSFASLLDQCSESINRLFTSPQASCLWLMWNFYSLIIMNAYDGELFSYLASHLHLKTPDTLKEIAYSSYNVVSINTFLRSKNGTRIDYSTLDYLLQPEIAVASLPKYYEDISRKLHFFSIIKHTHEQLIDKILQLSILQPHGLALVDTEFNIRMFDPILDLATKIRVVKRKNIDNFLDYSVWLLRKYYLTELFQNVLWQSVQSGLYDFWETNNLFISQLAGIRKKIHLQKRKAIHATSTYPTVNQSDVGTTIKTSVNVIGYLVQSLKGGIGVPDDEDGGSQATPISLGLLESVLQLGRVMLCISVVVLVLENLYCHTGIGKRVSQSVVALTIKLKFKTSVKNY
ncbi:unnamed protein product [Orchesella dallaii]|uniref:Uncharacterized protein n=1 Tax=Orchesella dallaii TaxID=48710 RepID=A0ABP1RFD8_9HEXA